MLMRSPLPKRTKRQARNRRYQAHQKAGEMVLHLVVGQCHIDLLRIHRWLPMQRDSYSRAELERALQALIDDAARALK
jgi:hypothetical protein